jgi:ubiquinol-cytochrome c reductase cytochrome b subunit
MKVGPSLNGLSKRETRNWVESHFTDPPKYSPGSIMPPYKFSQKDLDNITSYLLALPE